MHRGRFDVGAVMSASSSAPISLFPAELAQQQQQQSSSSLALHSAQHRSFPTGATTRPPCAMLCYYCRHAAACWCYYIPGALPLSFSP